ncbi:MAG: hypothetical protein JRH16_18515 [Deltaproteobacteria bacterium]|nr:hypothetical protein [Deltaproteobacteria bacterium]MBW2362620.1 hypothetical protein [Deltaproteobacteria bacterium]
MQLGDDRFLFGRFVASLLMVRVRVLLTVAVVMGVHRDRLDRRRFAPEARERDHAQVGAGDEQRQYAEGEAHARTLADRPQPRRWCSGAG